MTRAALTFLLATVAFPALAMQDPTPTKEDPNVKTVPFSPMQRVHVTGVVNRVTSFTYDPGEHIGRIQMGSDDYWKGPDPKEMQNAPLRNNLSLWGIKPGVTNMQITTIKQDGSENLYQYELEVVDEKDAGKLDARGVPLVTYGLIYTYPKKAQLEAQEAVQAKADAKAEQLAKARLITDVYYGQREWRYAAIGKDTWLAPNEISNNGEQTVLKYNGNRPVPTILIPSRDLKTEQTATVTPRDEFALVQGNPCAMVLRQMQGETPGVLLVIRVPNGIKLSDPKLVEHARSACDETGYNPGTGTTSPEVVRQLRTAAVRK